MKKAMAAVMSMALCVALVGCGGAGSSTSSDNVSSTAESNSESESIAEEKVAPILIDELPWEATTKISDSGDREYVVAYTNNSEYPIIGFDVTFTLKEDLSDEDMELFSDLKDKYDYADEELQELTMKSYNETYTAPGEKALPQPLTLDNYAMRVPSNMDQIDKFEPDIATIGYITDDDVVHMEFYDFKEDSYTVSNQTVDDIHQVTTGFVDLLPEVDAPVLIASHNDDKEYTAVAYGVSQDTFNTFVEKCKDKGFTNGVDDSPYRYSANNMKGFDVKIYFNSDENTMNIHIEK